MKKITNKTILKQRDKIFSPVESEGVIYWRDEYLNFVAQSENKLENIPVINLSRIKRNSTEFSLDKINSISTINVYEQFNIINYE